MENVITREVLQQIWDHHGLGKIEMIQKPAQGVVNYCLIINDRYVIRFDALENDDMEHRYQTEKLFYTRLHGILPVPEIIVLDETKTLVPCIYLITSKMPGNQIVLDWHGLTPEQQQTIAFQAGEYLAIMHNVMLLKDFGDPMRPMVSWAAFVNDFAERYMQETKAVGALDDATLDRIREVLRRAQPLLRSVQQSVMVHSDYHFENVLQDQGQVTGMIDFEWAVLGDPAWDFRVEDEWEMTCPGSRAAVYAGYQSHRELREQHQQCVALYKMLLWVDQVSMGITDPNHQQALKFMRVELEWLESNLD